MSGKSDSDVSDAEHESVVGDSPSPLQQGEDEIIVIEFYGMVYIRLIILWKMVLNRVA